MSADRDSPTHSPTLSCDSSSQECDSFTRWSRWSALFTEGGGNHDTRNFNRPSKTQVHQGELFVSDGHGNRRVVAKAEAGEMAQWRDSQRETAALEE